MVQELIVSSEVTNSGMVEQSRPCDTAWDAGRRGRAVAYRDCSEWHAARIRDGLHA
jgi:hypothetical protein